MAAFGRSTAKYSQPSYDKLVAAASQRSSQRPKLHTVGASHASSARIRPPSQRNGVSPSQAVAPSTQSVHPSPCTHASPLARQSRPLSYESPVSLQAQATVPTLSTPPRAQSTGPPTHETSAQPPPPVLRLLAH